MSPGTELDCLLIQSFSPQKTDTLSSQRVIATPSGSTSCRLAPIPKGVRLSVEKNRDPKPKDASRFRVPQELPIDGKCRLRVIFIFVVVNLRDRTRKGISQPHEAQSAGGDISIPKLIFILTGNFLLFRRAPLYA